MRDFSIRAGDTVASAAKRERRLLLVGGRDDVARETSPASARVSAGRSSWTASPRRRAAAPSTADASLDADRTVSARAESSPRFHIRRARADLDDPSASPATPRVYVRIRPRASTTVASSTRPRPRRRPRVPDASTSSPSPRPRPTATRITSLARISTRPPRRGSTATRRRPRGWDRGRPRRRPRRRPALASRPGKLANRPRKAREPRALDADDPRGEPSADIVPRVSGGLDRRVRRRAIDTRRSRRRSRRVRARLDRRVDRPIDSLLARRCARSRRWRFEAGARRDDREERAR